MCGLAMGTKYNALIAFLLLTSAVPFLCSRFGQGRERRFWRGAGQGLLFFVVALAVCSPWMIRNYHWKNNPIYPFYDRWFNPPEVSRAEVVSSKSEEEHPSGPFAFRKVIYEETGWDIALLPFRIFFQGKDGDPRYFDGKLNPFLLFFTVLAFYRIREDTPMVRMEKKVMLLFSILFFAFAFFSFSLRIRYIAPIIPPLVILSVMGMKKTADQLRKRTQGNGGQIGGILVTAMAAVALTYNAAYVVGQFHEVKPLSYLRGHLSRDEYIAHYRPEYPAMQYINRHLHSDSLIFFVYLGNRGYYCDRRYRFGENLLAQLLVTSEGSEKILEGFRKVGATHLLVYTPLFEKWMKQNLSFEKQSFVYKFISKYTKVIFNKQGFAILYLSNDIS
jgi:hypothetical protein